MSNERASYLDEPLEDLSVVDTHVHVMRPERVQKRKSELVEPPYKYHIDPEKGGLTGAYPSHAQIEMAPSYELDYTLTESGGISDSEEELVGPLVEGAGVDVPVLNMGPIAVDELHEPRRRIGEMRASNDVLRELFLEATDDAVGLATIAMSEPEETVAEINRVANMDQIVGLYTTVTHADPPLGDPMYDPIYEAAEANGLPIALHSGESSRHYPRLDGSVRSFLESYTAGNLASHAITLASMVYNGIPAKFPDLEFLCLGGGSGQVAGLIGRMNRDYRTRQFDAPLLDAPPGEYVRKNWHFSTHPLELFEDGASFGTLVDVVGVDSIVFGSNYPLYDVDPPTWVHDKLEGFTQAELEAVFSGNAADLFGLDV